MIFALLCALCIACFVPTLIPSVAGTTIKALSVTLSAASTSPIKSNEPGVSIILILQSFHSKGITVKPIEVCLFTSSAE